jgi:hypothetical protein
MQNHFAVARPSAKQTDPSGPEKFCGKNSNCENSPPKDVRLNADSRTSAAENYENMAPCFTDAEKKKLVPYSYLP